MNQVCLVLILITTANVGGALAQTVVTSTVSIPSVTDPAPRGDVPVGQGVQLPSDMTPIPPPVASDASRSRSRTYEGFTTAAKDVIISSEEMGRIIAMPVDVGMQVNAGDVIAKLDDAIQSAAVHVARIRASMRGEQMAAIASRDSQAKRVETFRDLARRHMAGPDELTRAELELAIAEARVATSREEQTLQQAELERLEMQWRRRTLTAPFAAVVAERFLTDGGTIIPGNAAVVRLLQTDVLHGTFNVPASDLDVMSVGQQVQLYLRAGRQTVSATIDAIAPMIDAESGTVEVRVAIDNRDGDLQPGDRCTMRVQVETRLSREVRAIRRESEVTR
ncbi:MAG: efflux RND transporter periplasmic adaptor subunit [Planctomycetota bacterium]